MKKSLTALAISLAISTAAHAGPTAPSYTLDVMWTHDGAQVRCPSSAMRSVRHSHSVHQLATASATSCARSCPTA